jgi:hypothetical protein
VSGFLSRLSAFLSGGVRTFISIDGIFIWQPDRLISCVSQLREANGGVKNSNEVAQKALRSPNQRRCPAFYQTHLDGRKTIL